MTQNGNNNMNGLNVNVGLCEKYDESTRSVQSFFNEVTTENNRATLCIFSMISYIGKEKVTVELDYFLKCIKPLEDTEKDYTNTKIPLYSLELVGIKNSDFKTDYEVFESIIAQSKNVKFPTKGIYQIEIYEMNDETKKIDQARERYNFYKEENILPISAFRFQVK